MAPRLLISAALVGLVTGLVPSLAPRARVPVLQRSSVVESGTSQLEDTEGLGAEFEGALVDDEAWDVEDSGDEDMLAGFDLDGVRPGVRRPGRGGGGAGGRSRAALPNSRDSPTRS